MNMLLCILTFCVLQMMVDAQITISADKSLPRDGETVNLICSISSFIVPATWSVSTTGLSLTVCPPSGSCQPPNNAARYTYSATASSIGVTITSFNSMQDTFGWRCQHGTNSAVYVIKPVVPVTTVQLTNTSGEILTSIVNVIREGFTFILCSTAPRGSRPRATFRWYNKPVNRSPVLIGNQSISSTPNPIMVPGQLASDLVISYSTLNLMSVPLYQNIFCEARDEASTGNYTQSVDVQINVVYPPVVQVFPKYPVYNVIEGLLNFVFNCNIIEANPLPQSNGYSWLHRSLVIQGQNSFSYTIASVQKSHSGEYRCTARNDYGSGTSNSLALDVQYPPSIQGLTSPYKVIEYQPINVTCQVSSNPPPNQISWSPSGEGSVPSRLYYSSVSIKNRGIYSCTAQNTMTPTVGEQQTGMSTNQIHVDVLYPPYMSGMNSSYKVIEYQPLNVTCQVSSNPPPDKISWFPTGEGSVSSILYFSSVSRNKSGNYSCTAQNTMTPTVGGQQTGMATSQTQVDVLYPATITEFLAKDNITEIMENSTFHLYCHVDSNPYSVISLTFGDVLKSMIRDSSELTYNATAGCLNSGKYICSATNSIMNGVTVSAEVNLNVQCSPRLDFRKIISFEYYKALNDNITLEVSVIAYPEPTNIMWYHRAADTHLWERLLNQSISSTGLHSNISVHLGSQRDFGDYLVNMSNSFGIYELVFHVIPEKITETPPTFQVGPIAGGVASGAIVAVICIILVIILLRRRNQGKKEGPSLKLEGSSKDINRHESGLVENPVYNTTSQGFGPSTSNGTTVTEYAAFVKPKKKVALVEDSSKLYAQVEQRNTKGMKGAAKGKQWKGSRGDIHENIDMEGTSTNVDCKYENSRAEACDENVYENPGTITSNNPMVNKGGLLYADLMMDPPTTRNGKVVVQGIENHTEYAEIAYGMRGKPLPDNVGKKDE
ncbi:hypothetical protein CHS0354_026221 [Potamilus streckersoni]|uniref:Ig-like domain-containing protein n=1 Tax=Potamilus streckersoni TaxID=2493646 RepID=A0AAE0TCM7_9BIVA|nr:hypothetical protein CHS0354_026221 [Potamilus streckersoni]